MNKTRYIKGTALFGLLLLTIPLAFAADTWRTFMSGNGDQVCARYGEECIKIQEYLPPEIAPPDGGWFDSHWRCSWYLSSAPNYPYRALCRSSEEPPPPPPQEDCGNNKRETGEDCDGTDMGICQADWPVTVECNSNCDCEYTCHYISEVLKWSACSFNHVQVAEEVRWSTTPGRVCENIPTTRPCNDPPTIKVEVTPNPAYQDQDLTCRVTETIDPQGDTVTYTYKWSKDGVEQAELGIAGVVDTSYTISYKLTSAGEIWECVVTPHDGIEAGPPASDEAEIIYRAGCNGIWEGDDEPSWVECDGTEQQANYRCRPDKVCGPPDSSKQCKCYEEPEIKCDSGQLIWGQTDWVAGLGQESWADERKYLSDNGFIDISRVGEVARVEKPTGGPVFGYDSGWRAIVDGTGKGWNCVAPSGKGCDSRCKGEDPIWYPHHYVNDAGFHTYGGCENSDGREVGLVEAAWDLLFEPEHNEELRLPPNSGNDVLYGGGAIEIIVNVPADIPAAGEYYVWIDGEYSGVSQSNEYVRTTVNGERQESFDPNHVSSGKIWWSCHYPTTFTFNSGDNRIRFTGPYESVHFDAYRITKNPPPGIPQCYDKSPGEGEEPVGENGVLVSSIFDSGRRGAEWGNLEWDGVSSSSEIIGVYFRAGESSTLSGVAWQGPFASGEPMTARGRYAQYTLILKGESDRGPTVEEVRFCMPTATRCGDGIVQRPNEVGTGGPLEDGNEECDLNDLTYCQIGEVCDMLPTALDGDPNCTCSPPPPTRCGDGIVQRPNEVGTGGIDGQGTEDCDTDDLSYCAPGQVCDMLPASVDGSSNCTCVASTLTRCGDGIVQRPNEVGTGGPNNDGIEECDTDDLSYCATAEACDMLPTALDGDPNCTCKTVPLECRYDGKFFGRWWYVADSYTFDIDFMDKSTFHCPFPVPWVFTVDGYDAQSCVVPAMTPNDPFTFRFHSCCNLRVIVGGLAMAVNSGFDGCKATVKATSPEHSCGFDMVLIMDSSGSISNAKLQQMKDAFKGFVDKFLPNTLTQIAVVDFDTIATVRQDYTSDINDIEKAIDASTTGGFTNWEDALEKAHNLFDNRRGIPDMYIFASDGNPNRYGDGPTTDTEAAAVAEAVKDAEEIKAKGVRIIAFGIGDNIKETNLKAIASDGDYYATDFDTLAGDLSAVAEGLCGRKEIPNTYWLIRRGSIHDLCPTCDAIDVPLLLRGVYRVSEEDSVAREWIAKSQARVDKLDGICISVGCTEESIAGGSLEIAKLYQQAAESFCNPDPAARCSDPENAQKYAQEAQIWANDGLRDFCLQAGGDFNDCFK
ncbi:MAG: VWA domain-containing protein [Candidatus Altiarchaeota archaeon]|nr:VWA domain-containing protein [Candidatus Altiarchaeota archaeon]